MSVSSFFESLFVTAENAITAAAPVAQPVIAAAEAMAPVVEALAPSTAPVITAVEAGAASISAIAPTAAADAAAVVAAGRKAYADLGPAIAPLESALDKLLGITPAGQAVVLTPKTTAATAPAKSS